MGFVGQIDYCHRLREYFFIVKFPHCCKCIDSSKLFDSTFITMSTTHRHRYKNTPLNSTEMRRRREEEGVQIRKQKREQQLIKRRNVVSEVQQSGIEEGGQVYNYIYISLSFHVLFILYLKGD